ncbi:PD-(D/E)XK nuclease family protein [Bacillus stercoris]|nr:PD-(D/E)XK nuclease family protein [Bacillus stercoris]
MEISLDELHAYLHCPMQYQFKYKTPINGEESDSVKFSKALHKTVFYFYYSLMGGWMPSQKQMKDKWANLWREFKEGKIDPNEFILKEHSSEPRKADRYVINGYELIHNFYHYNKDNHGIPIVVDREYRVPIAGVTVTGKFELVRESIDKSSPNRFIEIVDFKTGNEITDSFLLRNDLNLTIASYAFRNLFQNAKEDRIVLNYLKTGKQVLTSRSEKDYDRMKAIVEGVAEGIANKRFYPRQTFMCRTCPFKDACGSVRF